MVARRAWLVIATIATPGTLGACSGKPRTEEPAPRVATAGDAALPGGASARVAAVHGAAPAAPGELQVRVDWPDVPAAARRSPGRTPCGTPRAPSAAPTTTWGIPDALVVVEGAPLPGAPLAARITLADCALTPPLATGTSLAITSAAARPARLVLRKRGTLDRFTAGDPVPVMLPIAGHTVTSSLDAGAIYSLETEASDPEIAFIAALPGGQVTDAAGRVVIRDLAPGAHTVTAWLPPRAGQPARIARGTATVASGELTELTIQLAP